MVAILTNNVSDREAFFVGSILKIIKVDFTFVLPTNNVNFEIFTRCIVCREFSNKDLIEEIRKTNKIYNYVNLKPFFKFIPVLEGRKSYKKDHNYRVMTVITDEVLHLLDEILLTIDVPNSIIFIDTKKDITKELSKLRLTHVVYPVSGETSPFINHRKKYYGATAGLSWCKNFYHYDMIRNNTIVFHMCGSNGDNSQIFEKIDNMFLNRSVYKSELILQKQDMCHFDIKPILFKLRRKRLLR